MTSAAARPGWKRWTLRLALTVAVTWIVVTSVGGRFEDALNLGLALPNVSPPLLAFATLILLLALATSAILWGRIAGELGGVRVPAAPAIRIVLAASLGRYLPGKLWQLAALSVFSGQAGFDRGTGAAAGVIGQVFALCAAAVLGAPALLGRAGGSTGATLALFAALAIILGLLSHPGLQSRGLKLASRIARAPSPHRAVPGRVFVLRYFGMYFLNWLLYCGAFVFFVQGLGFPTADTLTLVSAFAGSYLLGYAALFAPAGIGVREGFLIAFLTPGIGAGAVGIAILTRLWMTVVDLVPATGLVLWQTWPRAARPGHDSTEDQG